MTRYEQAMYGHIERIARAAEGIEKGLKAIAERLATDADRLDVLEKGVCVQRTDGVVRD